MHLARYINLLECPIPPPLSSVCHKKSGSALPHLKGGSRSLGKCWVNKYRSSSLAALSRSLQPANDEYENHLPHLVC